MILTSRNAKIYPLGTKLLNSMIALAHADLRELLRPPQTSLSRFLSSRIATVGEHNMNEANKRQYQAKKLTHWARGD